MKQFFKHIGVLIMVLLLMATVACTNSGVTKNSVSEKALLTPATPATVDEVASQIPTEVLMTEAPTEEPNTLPTEIADETEDDAEISEENVVEAYEDEDEDEDEDESDWEPDGSIRLSDYGDYELELLARQIYVEVGCEWIPDWVQRYVGSVVLNRIDSELFPDDIESVIYDPGQFYPPALYWYEPDERTIENARWLLENGSVLPPDVLGENGEATGDGIYDEYYDDVLGDTLYFTYVY